MVEQALAEDAAADAAGVLPEEVAPDGS
jgi:hypothetical protein